MPLTPSETLLAIKISQAIQNYMDKHPNELNLSSVDVYNELRKYGLVEEDRHGGIKFRQFLKKLHEENALDLIPQVRMEARSGKTVNWKFISAPGKTIRVKNLKPLDKAGIVPTIDVEAIRAQLDQFPKIDPSNLKHGETEIRKSYPRAYEFWTPTEEALLKQASEQINDIFQLSKIFHRQPSAIQRRFKEVFGIEI